VVVVQVKVLLLMVITEQQILAAVVAGLVQVTLQTGKTM
jgi:hypothetical protein